MQAAPGRELRDGAAPRRRPRARGRDGQRQASTCSPPSSPARSAATRCRSSSRACSRSTTRWAPARAATASATSTFFDPKRVVALPELSLAAGAIKGWDRRNQFYFQMLQSLARALRASTSTRRSRSCPRRAQQVVLYGSGKRRDPVHLHQRARPRRRSREHAFEGIIPNLERRYRETDSMAVREELAKYHQQRSPAPTATARGCAREARYVQGRRRRATQRAIYEIARLPLRDSARLLRDAEARRARRREIADKIVKEIVARLKFLNNVGLDYLSLDRSADTLSGGEAQRIRLASQIGSGLTGVMYVLDEPSIGLHQRDNDRLIAHAQAPARPRQQRDRGRARRGRDPRRRLRGRHGPGRRRARRPGHRAGHARGDR